MYAIIQAGGRQMRVTPGGFATIDGTAGEPGAELTLERGPAGRERRRRSARGLRRLSPTRASWRSSKARRAGPKIRVFKKKRRKGMRRTKGHRADLHARAHQGNLL